MPDDSSACPRCRTKLSGEERCPVCGLDVSGGAASAGASFADALISALPSKRLGGYVIDGELSSGTRRAVLRGHSEEQPDRLVVIKAVAHDRSSPSVQEELIDLARRAVGVRHDALATLLEVGADAGLGLAYFVSELAPGTDLAELLTDFGTMRPVDVAALGLSLVHALDVLHAAGALHMDIKPAHVVLDEEGFSEEGLGEEDAQEEDEPPLVRLVETGFAPVLLASSGHGETAHEPIVGTPTYVAPEQARDVTAAGPASDLYSLGATMYHLLAGRPPFVGDSAVGILVQHASREAPPVRSLAPAVPDALAEAIDSLLAKNPANRPGAADVARLLSGLVAPPRRRSREKRSRAGPAAAGPRPLSRTWLALEATLAEVLLERRAVTRADIQAALAPAGYSPQAARGIVEVLVELDVLSPEDRTDCEAEAARRQQRHVDAAYGRLAMELDYVSRQDLDRWLADTHQTGEELGVALVRAGVLTQERADIVETSCLRYLAELDSAAHQRLARRRGMAADAVTTARSTVGALPTGDDRSLFEIMLEQGSLTPDQAWALAAEHVRQAPGMQ